MNLHEYQAKQLFSDYGIPIPEGRSASTARAARHAAETLGGKLWVVKAQVHAGGRGKAGGVKLVKSFDEVEEAASALLGSTLKTHQTGAKGLPINTVLVETGSEIERELYLSALVDRGRERVVFMASPAGGMDIEEVAATSPEKIFRVAIDPACGVQPYEIRLLGFGLGFNKEQLKAFGRIVTGIYALFMGSDASLVEINPLIVTKSADVMALDAKVNLDDNALFRHQELAELRDETQEDEVENEASRFGLSYVSLDGDIACMVNGAGLAMATMDIIKLQGGAPANFLDVGGGATTERVTAAFKLILANEDVKAILVNIFGGIVRCDLIAEGIIAAVKEVDVSVPVVVRLEGTNVDKGKQLLAESDVDIITADDLTDGAKKVVAEAQR